MPQKNKLKLNDLKVLSFTTSTETFLGGTDGNGGGGDIDSDLSTYSSSKDVFKFCTTATGCNSQQVIETACIQVF